MQIGDLVALLGGQLRLSPPGTITGWGFSAALGMAAALGINPAPVAETLPLIEAVVVRVLNE